MQAREYIGKAVKILTEIDSLNEQLKDLKAEAKESELDVMALTAAAKAIVSGKTDELIEKSEAIIEAVNLARS
jgi:uncharacterized coiled-coil DUF342 family protein